MYSFLAAGSAGIYLFKSVFDSALFAADGMSCHCTVCQGFASNSTSECELKPGGQCFASVEIDEDGIEMEAFGCFSPVDAEGGTILQV